MKKFLVKMGFLHNFSELNFTKLFFTLFVSSLLIISITSCKKNKEFGIELSPESQTISTFLADTFFLNTFTDTSDKIKTDELSGASPLGNYIDPVFGEVNSSIFAQIRLNQFNAFDDTNNLVIDSVVLYLAVDGSYGDIGEQIFKVEQLDENIYVDSNYYSNENLNVVLNNDLSILNSIEINPLMPGYFAGLLVDKAILRIELDIEKFANPILNQTGTSVLSGNDGDNEFLSYFKGIKISSNNGVNGGLYYIDMLNNYTKIRMFYRDTTGLSSEHDTLEFDFNINSNCAFFHNVTHNYNSTIIEQALNQSEVGQNQFYIQSLGGLNSFITIPGLNSLLDSNIIINKAEIKLPCENYEFDNFPPSNNLFLTRKNENQEDEFLPDFFQGNFDGQYNNLAKNYTFNITSHINEIMSGKTNNDTIKVLPSGSGITANRTILNGFNTINKDKAKLIITYTKY